MDFLILRPLSPETGHHFFEGGGGVSNLWSEGSKQWGGYLLSQQTRSNGNAADCRLLGRRLESLSDDCHPRRRRHVRPNRVRTADPKVCGWMRYHPAIACPEDNGPPHCLEPSLPLTKNPHSVLLSD